ncbi:MAG: type II toxin-antitoxin system HicA family toxin [Candidatus Lindowbacteria bacterium]|nr:type II toxin-antitoxin system HicA family toxin [Candidatus Lindowbacteria bacterium]
MPRQLPKKLRKGFRLDRTKGSHRVYVRNARRVVVPFHAGRVLHPKVVKQALKAIRDGMNSHLAHHKRLR